MPPRASTTIDNLCNSVALALADKGYVVLDAVLESSLAERLADAAEAIAAIGAFKPAGAGRSSGHRFDTAVRGDGIYWLSADVAPDSDFLEFCDLLRQGLNSRMYLGLVDHEAHYARYAPGAFYAMHRDAFGGQRNRALSTVYYLNRDWPEGAGGELVLYDDGGKLVLETVSPCFNRFVVFLSERFPHEVKPATRSRYSVSGWFRGRR